MASSAQRDSTAATALRRRRAASFRCPVLADGRRDPIELPKSRPVIVVRVLGANTMEFTGADRAVLAAIKSVGVRFQRAPRGGAWLVRGDLAADVEALLTYRGYIVQGAL